MLNCRFSIGAICTAMSELASTCFRVVEFFSRGLITMKSLLSCCNNFDNCFSLSFGKGLASVSMSSIFFWVELISVTLTCLSPLFVMFIPPAASVFFKLTLVSTTYLLPRGLTVS